MQLLFSWQPLIEVTWPAQESDMLFAMESENVVQNFILIHLTIVYISILSSYHTEII